MTQDGDDSKKDSEVVEPETEGFSDSSGVFSAMDAIDSLEEPRVFSAMEAMDSLKNSGVFSAMGLMDELHSSMFPALNAMDGLDLALSPTISELDPTIFPATNTMGGLTSAIYPTMEINSAMFPAMSVLEGPDNTALPLLTAMGQLNSSLFPAINAMGEINSALRASTLTTPKLSAVGDEAALSHSTSSTGQSTGGIYEPKPSFRGLDTVASDIDDYLNEVRAQVAFQRTYEALQTYGGQIDSSTLFFIAFQLLNSLPAFITGPHGEAATIIGSILGIIVFERTRD